MINNNNNNNNWAMYDTGHCALVLNIMQNT